MLKMVALSAQLSSSLQKGAIVGAVSGVLSVLVLDGMSGVQVLGQTVPKFAAHALILGVSSVATDYVIPAVTPFMAAGNPSWTRFENLALQPLLIGTISLAIESVVAPQAEVGRGDVLKTIAVGGASSITASYVSAGMGWSAPIV